MSADYTSQAAAAIGLKLRSLANLAWPQVLERARQGEIDLIPCIAKPAERKTFLDFSVPDLTFPLVIVTRDNSHFIGGIEDLHEKTLAVVPQTITREWLSKARINFTPFYVQSRYRGLKRSPFHGRMPP